MQEQEIKVKQCHDCPFYHLKWDSWAVGRDTITSCNLEKKTIEVFDTKANEEAKVEIPEWCPLKKASFLISLKKT